VRDTNLILVEGMPGTGKSTVSQFIDLQLRAQGQASFWCHEERAGHPVRLFYASQRHLSWSDYCEEAASLWQNYARQLHARGQIAVLDASILQNHLRSMLLFDSGWSPILDLVRTIENLLVPLRPVWIYLKPNDVERNFRDVVETRGQSLLDLWIEAQERFPYASRKEAKGFSGFIAFWQEFGELADRVFDDLTIPKLRQVVTHAASEPHIGGILEFLDVPLSSDRSPLPVLDRFVGEYLPVDDHTARAFTLQAKGGFLIMCCDRPTMDVRQGPIGCYREIRLISNGQNRFYVAAWPHQIEFAEDRTGTIVTMRLSTAEEGWSGRNEVYARR
jgi:hypothetical protein